jgi:hypothetical protein
MRVLHVPTTQPAIFAAINNPNDAPPDLHALLFAIYLAAVASLPPADTQLLLGQDQQSALCRFQRGIEVQLHKASFLDAPTIASIQAMSISLVGAMLFLFLCLKLRLTRVPLHSYAVALRAVTGQAGR